MTIGQSIRDYGDSFGLFTSPERQSWPNFGADTADHCHHWPALEDELEIEDIEDEGIFQTQTDESVAAAGVSSPCAVPTPAASMPNSQMPDAMTLVTEQMNMMATAMYSAAALSLISMTALVVSPWVRNRGGSPHL